VLVRYHVGHEYNRDSEWEESGLRNAIESKKMKFETFSDAFSRYPDMKASNLAQIGACHAMLGEIRQAAAYFKRALGIRPMSRKVYFQLARIGKFYVDRYLPGIGRLIDKQLKT
jgi:tetratricopeptide (TPR) repeat protein